MPTVPATTQCAHLGCKAHRSKLNSYCSEHGGIEYTERNGDGPYHTTCFAAKTSAGGVSRRESFVCTSLVGTVCNDKTCTFCNDVKHSDSFLLFMRLL
jgi:hypothetical protein